MDRARTRVRLLRLVPYARAFKWSRLLIYAVLICGALITVFPLVWLVRSSLMDTAQLFTEPPAWLPRPFDWSNYSGALTSQPFAQYLLNTMIIEVFAVTGLVITSAFAGYSFARLRWRGRNIVFGILLSSLMLPYAATLIPTFLMWDYVGADNTYFPLIVPAWFGGGGGGMFSVFLLRQFFLSIPRDLEDAAYVDGAKPFGIFWRIILPLSKPALLVVALFQFIFVWNDLLNPLIYLNDVNKYTLAVGLAGFEGQYTSQIGFLMAASTAVTVPIIALVFFGYRYFVEGIALTGVKG